VSSGLQMHFHAVLSLVLLYTLHPSSVCLLLFKVAKPEPETWVRECPNPKPRFGNSRPGLEGLVCTKVVTKTVSGSGRPNFDALASLDAEN